MTMNTEQQLFDAALQVPLQPATTSILAQAGVELWVRRDDRLDPQLSGNKFYKLFFNLQAAKAQGYGRVVSFGGAYSNHLHALAAAAQRYGIEAIGVVRGERPLRLSPSLQDAEAWGMQLVFVSRADYQRKTDPEWLADFQRCYGPSYLIPEGGANLAGARGMQLLGRALQQQLKDDCTAVCVPVGTGISLAGLAAGMSGKIPVMGFSVLKGEGSLGRDVARWYSHLSSLSSSHLRANGGSEALSVPNWRLISGFHGGGYGKKPNRVLQMFWQQFENETAIPLDPVYTIKMLWGIHSLAQQGYWPRGSRLVAIHTGGLQGRRGFPCPESLISLEGY